MHRTDSGVSTEYCRTPADLAAFEANVEPGSYYIDVLFELATEYDLYVNMASLLFKSAKHWRPYLGFSTIQNVDAPPIVCRKLSKARIDATYAVGRGERPVTESRALTRVIVSYPPVADWLVSSQTETAITLSFRVHSRTKTHGAAIFGRIANTAHWISKNTKQHRFVSESRMLKPTWDDITLLCTAIAPAR